IIWNGLFHNGGYHWVHHQYPFIPGYLLKTADRDLTPTDADSVSGWWNMYQLILSSGEVPSNSV
ncbi:MAG: fatty acid desaturase, partial [Cyanobacteria bacterium J06650_10]